MISAMSRTYRIPFEKVVYEMSLQNVNLYMAVIPPLTADKKDAVYDMRDPRNQDVLRKMIDNS